jgi:hypothetical protein
VIERKHIGGSCPNIACLPSKNIIHSAKVASYFRRSREFELSVRWQRRLAGFLTADQITADRNDPLAAFRPKHCHDVSDLNAARISSLSSSGCSQTAKCPPFSIPRYSAGLCRNGDCTNLPPPTLFRCLRPENVTRVVKKSDLGRAQCESDSCDPLRLDLGSAAVNEQFDTRDETGVIRRQKQPTLATFSGSPIRPIGIVDTICTITSADCRYVCGILIGPGLTTFALWTTAVKVDYRDKDMFFAFGDVYQLCPAGHHMAWNLLEPGVLP